jgi:hypothetical protein
MAQEWTITEHKADALKKQDAYTSYKFDDENGNSFVYWTWSFKDGDFRIVNSSSHIFNYESSDTGKIMRITIGFYDSQDNLVDNSNIKMKI